MRPLLGCRRPELTYSSDDCLATVGVGVKRQLNGRGTGEEVRLDPVPLVRSVLARFPVRARYWLAGAIPRHAHGLEGPGALNLLPPLWLLGQCPEDKLAGSRAVSVQLVGVRASVWVYLVKRDIIRPLELVEIHCCCLVAKSRPTA